MLSSASVRFSSSSSFAFFSCAAAGAALHFGLSAAQCAVFSSSAMRHSSKSPPACANSCHLLHMQLMAQITSLKPRSEHALPCQSSSPSMQLF